MPGVTQTGANPLIQEYATHYGVSEIPMMAGAAMQVMKDIAAIALPYAMIALTLHILVVISKMFIRNEFDFFATAKLIGLLLFLANYSEVTLQLTTLMGGISNDVGHTMGNWSSGQSLTEKVTDVETTIRARKYVAAIQEARKNGTSELLATIGVSFNFDIVDIITSAATHIIILMARSVTYTIREVYLLFLMAVGPFAILFSMFPGFEGNMIHWLKRLIAVSFWGVSLGILDRLLDAYLDNMLSNNSTAGYIPMNIGMCLMYCMAPSITSYYIAGGQTSLMQRMVGFAMVGINRGKMIMGKAGGGSIAKASSGKNSDSGSPSSPSNEKGKSAYGRDSNSGGAGFSYGRGGSGGSINKNTSVA